MRRTLAFKTR